MIPIARVAKALKDSSWDLGIDDGFPGLICRYENGKEICSYYRFTEKDAEPLIFHRTFHGIREGYWEILEEFRHYYNFYQDSNKFLFIDDNGDAHEAIIIEANIIRIKGEYLKEFLAAKQMYLALFFDYNRFSNKTLAEQGMREYRKNVSTVKWCYTTGARDAEFLGDNIKSQGWLMGKKLISGKKDFQPTLTKIRKYEKFIIGTDKNDKAITFTCNEEKLSNYFGKNKGAPHYLTPVFFKKEVLSKYYGEPSKYSVEDGYISCANLWTLRIDNNHPEHVCVFLGDLGHLELNEQVYWKHFNIAKKGKLSHTAWTRDFEAQFADPEKADLFFKYRFSVFETN